MLYMFMYLTSFILIMSCKDWFLIWLGLEINMVSFIMVIYSKYSMMNVESCLKYFFIQSLGSVLLLMFMYMSMYMFTFLGSILLCYKIGGGPFYFWFPSVCSNISWWSCFFLMTFQKFIPLMLMSLLVSSMLWMLSVMSLLVGVLGSMNQVNMKQLMAYSSIHHIGWMMISMMVTDEFWIIYLIIYGLMMMGWISFLDNNIINNIMSYIKFDNKLLIMLILLNLGGIPPLMGFFLKWWSFYFFLNYEVSIMLLLLIFSVIMLYIYFRVVYDFVMGGMVLNSWIIKNKFGSIMQYDVMILMSFCMGPFLGVLLI